MNIATLSPSPVHALVSAKIAEAGVELFIKRDDLLHPLVSGNKWRKLKYNVQEMQRLQQDTMLTFGGAFSNHIYAVAAAGKLFDFKTIGLIRGEAHSPLNPTLAYAASCGMQLEYVDRNSYRAKDETEFLENLKSQYGNCYILPEGGSNQLALAGCRELVEEININFDYICVACGTGATLSGIAQGLNAEQTALGFAALKATNYFENQLNFFLGNDIRQHHHVKIMEQYHFGGYARITKPLVTFIDWFEATFAIPLDPVYTAKMMYGIFDLLRQGYFPRGSRIVAVHTGGLQGLLGMGDKINTLRNQSEND